MVENKLPELDVEVVKNEALKVRMWLADCQREFMVQVPVYAENGDRMKGRTKEELALCGDNSIFNVLSRNTILCSLQASSHICIMQTTTLHIL